MLPRLVRQGEFMSVEEIYEPFAIQEIWADGMADAYVIGGVFKYTLFSFQKVPGMKGLHRVAVLKGARPLASIAEALKQTQMIINQSRLERFANDEEERLHAH